MVPTIHRETLSLHLKRYGFILTGDCLYDLTDTQAESVWDWMETYPEGVIDTVEWYKNLPDCLGVTLNNIAYLRTAAKKVDPLPGDWPIDALRGDKLEREIGTEKYLAFHESGDRIGFDGREIALFKTNGISLVSELERRVFDVCLTLGFGESACQRVHDTMKVFREVHPITAI